MAKAGRGDDQYMLRFPGGMRDRIKAAAEANGRSMNAEIIARIEYSFDDSLPILVNEQEAVMKEQSEVLARNTKLLDEANRAVDLLNGHLVVFGRAIDAAAKGNTEGLEFFLEAARRKPLGSDPNEEAEDE